MNDITKEFKKAAEDRFSDLKADYIANTDFKSSVDLYRLVDNAFVDTLIDWAQQGRVMSDVDFEVRHELDVDLDY